MADVIKLVQGDAKPTILLTLTNDIDKQVLDLSNNSTAVYVKFREAGSETLLTTITCSKVNSGTGGQVSFDFAGGVLDVEPGAYEGEIVIDILGDTETLYDIIRFRVRENF